MRRKHAVDELEATIVMGKVHVTPPKSTSAHLLNPTILLSWALEPC